MPLTLRRRDGDGRTRTDIFLVASEALVRLSYIPWAGEGEMRTGGVEPPQHEATGLQPAELADAQRPHGVRVAGRARTGACGDHNPGCFRLHHGHHVYGDDRIRTGGLSPDKRALCSSELRPRAKSRGWDSNPRSRAHEAREDGLSSTAQGLAGRSRTCDLRPPTPAGWPSSPTTRCVKHPRRDSNPQLPG